MNYVHFLTPHLKKAKIIQNSFFYYFFEKILLNNYLPTTEKIWIMNTFKILENSNLSDYLNINQTSFSNKYKNHKKDIQPSNKQIIKISIIIVCRDYENIRNSINSINAQIFDCLEIIIIYDDINIKVYNLNSVNIP